MSSTHTHIHTCAFLDRAVYVFTTAVRNPAPFIIIIATISFLFAERGRLKRGIKTYVSKLRNNNYVVATVSSQMYSRVNRLFLGIRQKHDYVAPNAPTKWSLNTPEKFQLRYGRTDSRIPETSSATIRPVARTKTASKSSANIDNKFAANSAAVANDRVYLRNALFQRNIRAPAGRQTPIVQPTMPSASLDRYYLSTGWKKKPSSSGDTRSSDGGVRARDRSFRSATKRTAIATNDRLVNAVGSACAYARVYGTGTVGLYHRAARPPPTGKRSEN